MTINRGCSHVRASHVVTCIMSRLAYDNSMALPPWLPWKNRASWVASVRREGPTLLRKPAAVYYLPVSKLYILARFTGNTCTWCV
jgi:hypothetical protein